MEIEAIYSKAEKQLSAELPFVVYRKPIETVVQGVFQKDNTLHTISQFNVSGFVFSPFDHNQSSILIPTQESEIVQADIAKSTANRMRGRKVKSFTDEATRLKYIQLVASGIEKIVSSNLKKIVLSRIEAVPNISKNPIELFKKLLKSYKDAFVYLWCHPKIGIWLGATPETLLEIKEDSLFTMALAGTQPYNGSITMQWGAKEAEEQQLVTDFIIEALEGKARDVNRSAVHTHKAGTLLHLKTDIRAVIDPESTDITSIIKALHPTPAVCGLPRSQAKSFILSKEGYDRSFYTGFLGELNMCFKHQNASHLFVNLRCMKIEQNTAIIYVGGGITKDSDPEKEWEETVRKTTTMKKVLL